jgi:hypothetical protein
VSLTFQQLEDLIIANLMRGRYGSTGADAHDGRTDS